LTGASNNRSGKALAKVRRGGPWNRELELYYGLLGEYKVTPIGDQQALRHQANVDDRAHMVWYNGYAFLYNYNNEYIIIAVDLNTKHKGVMSHGMLLTYSWFYLTKYFAPFKSIYSKLLC